MPDLSPASLVALMVAVAAGAVVQGGIGFGFALIAVPALGLLAPGSVPATALLLASPMTLVMAVRERAHLHARGAVAIVGGRLFGSILGAWIVVVVPEGRIAVVVGALIVLAVALSAVRLDVQPTPAVTVGAGFVAGVTGTAAAIGGPALAVAYQNRPGPELRATLALSFVAGQVLSIGALAVAGEVHAWHVGLAARLTPALLLGLWAARPLARFLDRGWLRPAVLGFALLAGVTIALRGLLGG
jgi:uncharacterized membrane protein YfcA